VIAAPIPQNDPERLAVLHALDVLDTPPQARFDHVTRLARRVFDVPIALITLVDRERQWFKSRVGLPATQTPRDVSFCAHAILQDEVMVVPDASQDRRFHDNPLVTGEPHIRFYAGCPLQTPDHVKLGTLCILDRCARRLEDDDRALLRDLAQMVSQDLISAQIAAEDPLTGLMNRRGFEQLAPRVLQACERSGQPVGLMYFDLDRFKRINDQHGHAEGDRALRLFATALRQSFREDDIVARLAGDEFVAVLPSADAGQGDLIRERLASALADVVQREHLPYPLVASAGFAAYDPARHADFAAVLAEADHAMLAAKPRAVR